MASPQPKAASSELTGGSGFTYEDTVVAYYLAQLLRFERAYGQPGLVTSVAIQQEQKNPMDDLVVGFDDSGVTRHIGLQIKRSITISGSESNTEFRAIISAAVATQRLAEFKRDVDKCGFIVEHVTPSTLRSLKRLIDWARASPTSLEFESRFLSEGNAAKDERELRQSLLPLLEASCTEDEVSFYRHFDATQMSGLDENGAWRAEVINRLQELIVTNDDGLDILLFDRLCRIAREGSANATTWTRESLLPQLRSVVTLRTISYLQSDLKALSAYSLECMNDVGETIDDFHVGRAELQLKLARQLEQFKVVVIGGLPGCGKSAILKRFAQDAAARGPVIFFKNDRLVGNGWTAFAASLGLKRSLSQLLSEIGSVSKPIVFIDGIDRIRPDQRGLILDVIRAIQNSSSLSNWRVMVTSRDQGLEAFRTWFPPTFLASNGIGDVIVEAFSEEESEQLAQSKPNLRAVLFGNPAVREIARRPFFASVLARSIPRGTEPQTEVDLISAWWANAGHDAAADAVPLRQRALIDIAENGVRNFGKSIPVRDLKDSSVAQITALKTDQIINEQRGGASLTFSHDIFLSGHSSGSWLTSEMIGRLRWWPQVRPRFSAGWSVSLLKNHSEIQATGLPATYH
ncbi:Predicted NTPase (NACHT family) [Janthinobacterium lividum]|uniref:AAA family ATPase n=1 Tax=Janthinobacterium lividum TaxID=29581 RepID=UPI000DFD63F9|nr:ATP-binding protein [Janthinobacterium lividum]STR27816.1 Predicted NTPase (NACHT family) [Janthinobacterium lividum]